jgi:3,4-dihydroxy 2-butanone 4-phosphate synthase/GTP cyclohydrolase II
MILLSNSRHSPVGLSGYGLAIVEERPIEVPDSSSGEA